VDAQASRKILKIGQELADEDEADEEGKRKNAEGGVWGMNSRGPALGVISGDMGAEEEERVLNGKFEDDEEWGDEEEVEEEVSRYLFVLRTGHIFGDLKWLDEIANKT
jgi:essential nuclear protein 1